MSPVQAHAGRPSGLVPGDGLPVRRVPVTAISLKLPWPPKELSPNARGRWPGIKATIRYRQAAFILAMDARNRLRLKGPLTPPVTAYVTFLAPDRRHRDEDNALASLKAAWDGLVRAGLLASDRASDLHIVTDGFETEHGGEPGVLVRLAGGKE